MNMTLEREFSARKLAHIVTVLRVKMIRYYEVILANQPQIPAFLGGDTPEKCADRDIENLFNTDINKFFEMYEKAYQELANETDF